MSADVWLGWALRVILAAIVILVLLHPDEAIRGFEAGRSDTTTCYERFGC